MIDMSKHLKTHELVRFVLPSIAMMILTSCYDIVDGFFVSNFAGKTPFAALNYVWPFITILGTIGFMLGVGGSAIVSKTRGQGDDERANRYFSLIVYAATGAGVIFAIIGALLLKPVLVFMGIDGEMLRDALIYGYIIIGVLPALVLQYAFQTLLVTAGKPKLGFKVALAAGVTNLFLDILLMVILDWGIAGGAIASGISMIVAGFLPMIYFAHKNSSFLRLGKTKLEWRVLGKAAWNGLSELMGAVAVSVVGIAYNVQLMRFIRENGVAAYGVVSYLAMVFSAVAMGYAVGVSPLMSYQYGARNKVEMQSLFKKSLFITVICNMVMVISSQLLAAPLSAFFVGYDQELYELTVRAMRLYALSYFFMGFSVYASSLFTSLGNGLASALVSFFRTLICEVAFIMILPLILGIDGIWLATPVAEICSVVFAGLFVLVLSKHYGYMPTWAERKARKAAKAAAKAA